MRVGEHHGRSPDPGTPPTGTVRKWVARAVAGESPADRRAVARIVRCSDWVRLHVLELPLTSRRYESLPTLSRAMPRRHPRSERYPP